MLPPRFHLLDETLADFLGAECGQETSGAPVSVLSAFIRAGLDPWVEGARLRRLPAKEAACALAPVIAPFVESAGSGLDAMRAAERLVPCLRTRPSRPSFRPSAGGNYRLLLLGGVALFLVLLLGSLGLLPGV